MESRFKNSGDMILIDDAMQNKNAVISPHKFAVDFSRGVVDGKNFEEENI